MMLIHTLLEQDPAGALGNAMLVACHHVEDGVCLDCARTALRTVLIKEREDVRTHLRAQAGHLGLLPSSRDHLLRVIASRTPRDPQQTTPHPDIPAPYTGHVVGISR